MHLCLYNSNNYNKSKHFKSSYNAPASVLCILLVLTNLKLTTISHDYCMSFLIQIVTNWLTYNRRNLFLHSCGGPKSKIKVLAVLIPLEAQRGNPSHASLLACGVLQQSLHSLASGCIRISVSVLTWAFPLCVSVSPSLRLKGQLSFPHWI